MFNFCLAELSNCISTTKNCNDDQEVVISTGFEDPKKKISTMGEKSRNFNRHSRQYTNPALTLKSLSTDNSHTSSLTSSGLADKFTFRVVL